MPTFDRASYAEHLASLADRDPAAPAWLMPGRETMSRAALVARIDDARRHLDDWGIGRGDVVAWPVIEREASSLLAIVPAIATLAPLPARMTREAYARTFERLRVKAVVLPPVVGHAAAEAADRMGVTIIQATRSATNLAGAVDLALARPTPSLGRAAHVGADVMFVSLTSGTTGKPKLVPHAWRAIAVTAQSLGDALGMREDDVSAHITSLHLANGLRTATMLALLNGGAVDILPEADLDAFLAAVASGQVTYTSSSFAMHRELLRRLDGKRVEARGRLRFVRIASGRLAPDEMDRLEAMLGVPVVTGLSCTETGTIAQQRLDSAPRVRGSVGTTVASELRVADERGNALPAGSVGEVQVRGPQVFAGYLDDAALTAASFVDGWFRLGDLGRLDERGELHLEGRLKDTINRGGEKISPQEIDAVLERVPGVAEAAAFGIAHPALGEEVVAAVVRVRGSALDAEHVIAAARAALGDRRAPRRVWFVDALPRTDSGKLTRAELPALVSFNGHAKPNVAASARASTPLETALGALWAGALRRDRVGLDDNFFMLGGDSLRGARLLTEVNAAFGCDLQVPALFDDANTVAGMARAIERARQ
jgi:acyl-CoA synthetase (AMP-forming)/AMP-acid ligase II